MENNSVWDTAFQSESASATPQPYLNGLAPAPLVPPLPRPWAPEPTDTWIDLLTANHDPTTTATCWQAIVKNNVPQRDTNAPILYNYENSMVYVERDTDDGYALVRHLSAEVLSNLLAQWVYWCRGPKVLATPPMRNVRNVMATIEGYMHLPKLTRIVSIPVFSKSGRLQTIPGHDRESGVLYAPNRGFEPLPVPDIITEDMLQAAKALIDDLISQFPFATVSDKTHAIALAILALVRDMINGPTPNHIVESSINGSGKDLLVKTLLSIIFGPGSVVPYSDPVDELETRKLLTASIRSGKQYFYLANVNRKLDSACLAAAIAEHRYSDRPFGQNKEVVDMRVRMIWITTGTNMSLHREHTRRGLRIRLSPKVANPELLDGEYFTRFPLANYANAHRAQLLQALHIICKWGIQQGLPKQKATLGTFENWSEVIGSILHCAGYQDFLANHLDFQATAATDTSAHAAFCALWYDHAQKMKTKGLTAHHRAGKFKTSELLTIAQNVETLVLQGRTDRDRATSLGHYLAAHNQTPVAWADDDPESEYSQITFQIEKQKANSGYQFWSLFVVDKIPRLKQE